MVGSYTPYLLLSPWLAVLRLANPSSMAFLYWERFCFVSSGRLLVISLAGLFACSWTTPSSISAVRRIIAPYSASMMKSSIPGYSFIISLGTGFPSVRALATTYLWSVVFPISSSSHILAPYISRSISSTRRAAAEALLPLAFWSA